MKKKEIAENAQLNFDEVKNLLSLTSLKTLVDDEKMLSVVGGAQDSICAPSLDSTCLIVPSLDSTCFIILPQDNTCN